MVRLASWIFCFCFSFASVESAERDDSESPDVVWRVDEEVRFDMRELSHRFGGFGTQVWAFNNNPKVDLEQKLAALDIRYVRLTRQGTSEQMRSLRELTDRMQIEWVYTVWSAPPGLADSRGVLEDVRGFAKWWVEQVGALARDGMTPHYIELMNEPDSMGHWSTGIGPATYNSLVKRVRDALDRSGFASVGIIGPGLAHLNWEEHNTKWIDALDPEAVAALAAWSTHSWDDGDLCRGGSSCIETQWMAFQRATRRKDAHKPIFVTEYASKEATFHGVSYPRPESTWRTDAGYYSATNTVAYAVRLYENSLALLNSGANVPFVWQLVDEIAELDSLGKSWGLVDINGRPKPAYTALTTLCSKLPVGAAVVRAPDQSSNTLYAAAFVHEDRTVVAIANDSDVSRTSTIRLANAFGPLEILDVTAFELGHRGEPSIGEADIGRVVKRPLSLVFPEDASEQAFQVRLPANSTMTIVLRSSETI